MQAQQTDMGAGDVKHIGEELLGEEELSDGHSSPCSSQETICSLLLTLVSQETCKQRYGSFSSAPRVGVAWVCDQHVIDSIGEDHNGTG